MVVEIALLSSRLGEQEKHLGPSPRRGHGFDDGVGRLGHGGNNHEGVEVVFELQGGRGLGRRRHRRSSRHEIALHQPDVDGLDPLQVVAEHRLFRDREQSERCQGDLSAVFSGLSRHLGGRGGSIMSICHRMRGHGVPDAGRTLGSKHPIGRQVYMSKNGFQKQKRKMECAQCSQTSPNDAEPKQVPKPESEHQAKTDITLANAMQLQLEPVPEEPIKHCGSHRSCERVRFDSRRLIST